MRIRTYGIRSDAEQMAAYRTALAEGVRTLEAAGKAPFAITLKTLGEVLAQPSDEADKAPGWLEPAKSLELEAMTSALATVVIAAAGALSRGAPAGYLVDILEGVRVGGEEETPPESLGTVQELKAEVSGEGPTVQEPPATTGRATPPARQR